MSSRIFDCPSCGAAVPFGSSIAVSAVCGYCQSLVVRREFGVETLGTVAQLPPDLSPIQIGTRGQWDGRGFEIIGRVRVGWEGGSWNEWCAQLEGNRVCWIADAQGFYMASVEIESKDLPGRVEGLRAGQTLRVDGSGWSIADIKRVRCLGAEGQLPKELSSDWRRTSVDLTSLRGEFASLEYEGDSVTFYQGNYASFEELKFENLRPVPGWSAEVPVERNQTRTLNCPGCGAQVQLRAAGQSLSAVCGSCGGVIDTSNPSLVLIQDADARVKKLRPLLPIGQRGRLRDVEYEVVGFMSRKDNYSQWQEYLLFNPWRGFDWLVTYQGHWSLVERVPQWPSLKGDILNIQGRTYRLFARERASVNYVLGEFYWKVHRGEQAVCEDWISPPEVVSKETYPELKEFTWSRGTYIDWEEVARAFKVQHMPEPVGIYLNQPNPWAQKFRSLVVPAIWVVVAYCAIQFAFVGQTPTVPLMRQEYVWERASGSKVFTTEHFELKGGSQPVHVKGFAGVRNAWLSLDVELVNAKTNETFPASLDIEYYEGVDMGEAWSEGSQSQSDDIPGVPAGEYFLNIEAEADPQLAQMPFAVTVEGGGLFWSNFFTGLFLLLLYPVYVWMRRSGFERNRWADSDYSPYTSSEDDE